MTTDDDRHRDEDPYSWAVARIVDTLDAAYERQGGMNKTEHDILSRVATVLQLGDPAARESGYTYDGDWPKDPTASANPRVMRAQADGLVLWTATIHPEVTPFDYRTEG